MSDSPDKFTEILSLFNQARTQPGGSMEDALQLVKPKLEEVVEEAVREWDPDAMLLVTSLIHVLVDCCRGEIPEGVADRALRSLEAQPDRDSLRELALQGQELTFGADGLDTAACSLIRFEAFGHFYAHHYGLSTANPGDEEILWGLVESGRAEIPGNEELLFDSPGGVLWFTDEDHLRRACGSSSGGIDGSLAYDRLGLDWSRRWREYDEEGAGHARAILVSASLRCRQDTLGGLRIPTGIEGWRSLPFVPRPAQARGLWPEIAGFTVDPTTGASCHPEGVHGRLVVGEDERCFTETCGEVVKRVPDRIDECGELIVGRALERIRG